MPFVFNFFSKCPFLPNVPVFFVLIVIFGQLLPVILTVTVTQIQMSGARVAVGPASQTVDQH